MKKSIKTNSAKKLQKPRLKLLLIGIVVLIFFAHILVTAYLFTTVYIIRKDTDPIVIRSMVYSAVDGLRKPVPVNYVNGDSYFAEAKVYVPFMQSLQTLLYGYSPASTQDGERFDEELIVTSSSVISAAKVSGMGAQGVSAFLETIPQLQACSRAFLIKFVDATPQYSSDYKLQAKVSLADGRTAYVYKDTGCKTHTGELQNALLTIRSYK